MGFSKGNGTLKTSLIKLYIMKKYIGIVLACVLLSFGLLQVRAMLPTQIPVLDIDASMEVKVKLSTPAALEHMIYSEGPMMLRGDHGELYTLPAHSYVRVVADQGSLYVSSGITHFTVGDILLSPKGMLPLRIVSWDRRPAWDSSGTYNDNVFRGNLHIYPDTDTLLVVNELPLESYMKGIAEVPEQDPEEKRKALAVVARSYVAHYLYSGYKKFEDPRYNASDNPAVFQKYLGYGFEQRSPLWQESLEATRGVVLLHDGVLFRAAYSSCTDEDGYRKTPEDIGWKDPYFDTVTGVYTHVYDPKGIDPVRSSKNQCGHGVGLSGLGASGLAGEGKNFMEILNYYYKELTYGRLY